MKTKFFYLGILLLGAAEIISIYLWITVDKGGFEPIFTIVNSIILPIYIFLGAKYLKEPENIDPEKIADIVVARIESKNNELTNLFRSLHESIIAAINKLDRSQNNKKFGRLNAKAISKLKKGEIEIATEVLRRIFNEEEKDQEEKHRASETARYIGVFLLSVDPRESIKYFNRSLELNPDNANALVDYGIALLTLGLPQEAFIHFQNALSKVGEDRLLHARILTNLGLLYQSTGIFKKAVESQEEALKIHIELNVERGIASNLSNLGVIYWENSRSQFATSRKLFEEAIELEKRTGNSVGEAIDLENLGVTYLTQGHLEKKLSCFDDAEKFIREAIKINEKIPNLIRLSSNYGNLGMVYSNRSDMVTSSSPDFQGLIDTCKSYLEKALKIAETHKFREIQANQLSNLGVVEEDLKNFAKAIEFWVKSRDIYALIGMEHKVRQLQSWIDNIA